MQLGNFVVGQAKVGVAMWVTRESQLRRARPTDVFMFISSSENEAGVRVVLADY